MNHTYTYSTTNNDGKLVSRSRIDNISGEQIAYQHDSLQRLSSATAAINSAASWSQQYIYDGFGNMKQKTGTGLAQLHSFNISMNSATNNGGTTSASYYDMDDRMLGPEYAPDNRRLTSAAAGGKTNVFFWLGSMRVATYQMWLDTGSQVVTQLKKEDLYLAGRRVEPADRLGSNLTSGFKLLPYGEELQPPNVDNDRTKFATYHRDVDGLDYADQRYYSPGFGRFLTADPSGDNWDLSNPQSWNAYAYVNGDPINFNDPEGLDCKNVELDIGRGIARGTTVGDLLSGTSDIAILSKTIFTEARVAYADMNAVHEKAAIASVIMNRWQIVNGHWKLFNGAVGGRRSGEVRTVPDWGAADGSIASIVYAPGPQFQVWSSPGTLERNSQIGLDRALASDELPIDCGSLLQSIGTAAGFGAARDRHDVYSDERTGLVFTGFQSALPGIRPHKSWYEQWMGAYGSANVFSGVYGSQVWPSNVPVPRPPRIPPVRRGGGGGR